MITKTIPWAVALVGLTVVSCREDATSPPDRQQGVAPLRYVADAQRATDRYVVVFWDTVTNPRAKAEYIAAGLGISVKHVYQRALRGFSARIPAPAMDALRRNPAVRFVEQVEAGKFRIGDHQTQSNPPWGLDRVDQRALPLNQAYTRGESGSGVRVYILDTGIRPTHTEFGNRASIGFDANPQEGNNGQDCHGHGTHVAGIVGGQTWGVAKAANLIGVKVNVHCSPGVDPDDLIAGIDWVAVNRIPPAVANISIWAPADDLVDQAVNNAINSGVIVVVGAANFGDLACNYSPARVPAAITVGATTTADARAGFSNFGTCVDIFAPGQGIVSAWATSDNATQTLDGTSQAAPHVAGTAALYLQRVPSTPPAQVWSTIASRGTSGVLSGIGAGSPNLLLHTHFKEVSISGPTQFWPCGPKTWTANASPIERSHTYTWEVMTNFITQEWNQIGTGQSVTYNDCRPFVLRVTATGKWGFHGRATHIVG